MVFVTIHAKPLSYMLPILVNQPHEPSPSYSILRPQACALPDYFWLMGSCSTGGEVCDFIVK